MHPIKNKFLTVVVGVTLLVACSSATDEQSETEKLLNQKRIETLKKGKDSLTQAREVIFWAKFQSEADIPCFESWLALHHFTVSYKTRRKDDAYPEYVEFNKSLTPTLDTMNNVTEDLIAASAACNGHYHEWEAPVVP